MIYEPQEDSYLMVEQIAKLKPKNKVLDLGTGSGILGAEAAKTASYVLCADKNPEAVEYVKKNHKNLRVIESSYFSNINEKFDLIINNPPYLPNDERIKDIALDGGPEGWEFLDNMLGQVKNYLNPDGQVLICFANLTKIEKVNYLIKKYGFDYEVLNEKELGIEVLYIYLLKNNGWDYLAEGKRNLVQKSGKLVRKWTKPGKQDGLFIEAEILPLVNEKGIGPKFVSYENNILTMTYIEGLDYESWIKKGKLSLLPKIITSLLNQAYKLDCLGIDKSEFLRPYTNIKIGQKIVLLDFERARKVEKPKNIQQLCSFIENKYSVDLRDLVKNYSKNRDKKSFDRIKNKVLLKLKYKPEYFRVWEELRKVPKGSTISYGELAKRAGVKSPRFIGKIMNSNPFAPHVPCHRVINSDGSIGGFASGIEAKKELLKKEGVDLN